MAGKFTLLIRLEGPMQSWGSDSQLTERTTEYMPTKSGVIGLICAALGKDRAEPVDDLAKLRMGVRIDAPGRLMTDFHTARDVRRGNTKAPTETVMTNRQYLCDASFLVGLESTDEDTLIAIENALSNPVYLLSLGRRSCPPSASLTLPGSGIRPFSLEAALEREPLMGRLSALAFIESQDGSLPVADVPTGAFYSQQSERLSAVRYLQPVTIGQDT